MKNFTYTYPEELRDRFLKVGFTTEDIKEDEESRTEDVSNIVEMKYERLIEAIKQTSDHIEENEKKLEQSESIIELLKNDDFGKFQEAYFEDEKNRIAGAVTDGTALRLEVKEELMNSLSAIGYVKEFIRTKINDIHQLRVDDIKLRVDYDYYQKIMKNFFENVKEV